MVKVYHLPQPHPGAAQPIAVQQCSGPCASLVCRVCCCIRDVETQYSSAAMQLDFYVLLGRKYVPTCLGESLFLPVGNRKPGWIAALEYWVRTEANRINARLSFLTGLCRRTTPATTLRTGSMCVFTQHWPPLRLEPNCDLSWKNTYRQQHHHSGNCWIFFHLCYCPFLHHV